MKEMISQIVAELFGQSKAGEEVSSKIHRLRDEVKKVIESENTVFGKFREMVESFRDIIPEERQRYNAAIKALSTTMKLSREEIVKAINDQLDELKILEKGLMPTLPDWRDEFTAMEAKASEMKGEIAKLREKIAQLESEEKAILNSMTAHKKEVELVEKAMKGLFADIGAEITYIKKKVEEFTGEHAGAPPVPQTDPGKADIFPSEKKRGSEKKSEVKEPDAQQGAEWEKKCPMCGGKMNYHISDELWQCYSCAYEERKG
jgi:chromosome segregation ATPase